MKAKTAAFLIAMGPPAFASDPLSAIDWLDNIAIPEIATPEPGIEGAEVPYVSITPLGATSKDIIGLLPSNRTGLPETIWENSPTEDLIEQFNALPTITLPTLQVLLYTLLLTEAAAPADQTSGHMFIKSHITQLMKLGAVEPALGLILQTNPEGPDLFDPWLDLALLTGTEEKACQHLSDIPTLSQSIAKRVYCQARAGEWSLAALSYDTGLALNLMSASETELLRQFLDPETAESKDVPTPAAMTPLVFRLFEAIGKPHPTGSLPLWYAPADLREISGWKAQIEAAERLARSGSLTANQLMGLYSLKRPAASGGVWDRVELVQSVETSITSKDPAAAANLWPKLWNMMQTMGLESFFAAQFGFELAKLLPKDEELHKIQFLLTEFKPNAAKIRSPKLAFMASVALLDPKDGQTPLETAITNGFHNETLTDPYLTLHKTQKTGELLLNAITTLEQATHAGGSDVAQALTALRLSGLERTAKQVALDLLVLRQN